MGDRADVTIARAAAIIVGSRLLRMNRILSLQVR
jgi:hypothetical protein